MNPEPLCLEVHAQHERHMQECDTLIADRIGCSAAYWSGQRERNFLYWEHEYGRARLLPPRRDSAAFTPGEYLRWSERHPAPAYTRWDWLGWASIAWTVSWLVMDSVPSVHDFFHDFFADLFGF